MKVASSDMDIDPKDATGKTPLTWAAINGHFAIIELLLNSGRVNINSRDRNGRTPLSWAAESGFEASVKAILEIGQVDINSRNKDGRTPLSFAVQFGNKMAIQMLLNTGQIDINSRDESGWTPLFFAITSGISENVFLLLRHGSDIDAVANTGVTPIMMAEAYQKYGIFNLLLQNGAKLLTREIAERGGYGIITERIQRSNFNSDCRLSG